MCESASYVGRKGSIFGEAGERGRSGQEQKLGWGWGGLHRRMERPVPRLKPIGQAACWAKVEWRTRSSGEAATRHVMFKGGFPRAFVLKSDRSALQRGWRGQGQQRMCYRAGGPYSGSSIPWNWHRELPAGSGQCKQKGLSSLTAA